MATVIRGPFAAEFAGVPPALELEEQLASDRQVISARAALAATVLRRRGPRRENVHAALQKARRG
jgi:hypothetical protein